MLAMQPYFLDYKHFILGRGSSILESLSRGRLAYGFLLTTE